MTKAILELLITGAADQIKQKIDEAEKQNGTLGKGLVYALHTDPDCLIIFAWGEDAKRARQALSPALKGPS
jgi:hypothetical protein